MSWDTELTTLTERIAGPLFNRPEPRSTFPDLVRSLLADVPRKNSWQLADHIGHVKAYRFEHLLNGAKWDADVLRDQVRSYVPEHLGRPDGVLIADDTSAIKQGNKSAECNTCDARHTLPRLIIPLPRPASGGAALCASSRLPGFITSWEVELPILGSSDERLPFTGVEDKTRATRVLAIPDGDMIANEGDLHTLSIGTACFRQIKLVAHRYLPLGSLR